MTVDHKAARARADACFRAPWVATNFAVECGHAGGEGEDCSRCAGEGETEIERIESPDEYPHGQVIADVPGLEMFSRPHAEFIAAARTDVPALCDEVDRLHGEVDRVASSFMDGEHNCNICERVTANGTCTECRHGTSPLLKARAEVDRLRAAITQALTAIEADSGHIDADPIIETLRDAIGIGVGP